MNKICIIAVLLFGCSVWTVGQNRYVFPTEVKPLLTSQWGQGYPYNKMCPWEMVDTVKKHTYAGCGPIVMSQVIRYSRYPSYSKQLNSRYDWTQMFDRPNDTTTVQQENAVAKLIVDCGTAANTLYGQSASSTKLTDLTMGLKKYFGYSRYMHIADRGYYKGAEGSKAWKTMIYNELKAGRPIIFRGEKGRRMAHVFIIDGCRDSTVHVNWGWNGKRDGYYDPDTLDGYRMSQRMVVEIAQPNYTPSIRRINVAKPGTLAKSITEKDWLMTQHVKISGTINKSDIKLLRQLAGGGRKGERNGNMSSIDMSEAVILTLPDSAFLGCDNLTYIALPITLPEISRYAFKGCGKLNYVKIQPMVNEIKRNAFMACFNLVEINLPKSLKRIDINAFNSCNSLTAVTIPPTVKYIGRGAFAYSKKLKSLSIPKSIPNIANDIIKGTSVKKIKRI